MHFHNNKTHIQTPEMRQTTPDIKHVKNHQITSLMAHSSTIIST